MAEQATLFDLPQARSVGVPEAVIPHLPMLRDHALAGLRRTVWRHLLNDAMLVVLSRFLDWTFGYDATDASTLWPIDVMGLGRIPLVYSAATPQPKEGHVLLARAEGTERGVYYAHLSALVDWSSFCRAPKPRPDNVKRELRHKEAWRGDVQFVSRATWTALTGREGQRGCANDLAVRP